MGCLARDLKLAKGRELLYARGGGETDEVQVDCEIGSHYMVWVVVVIIVRGK